MGIESIEMCKSKTSDMWKNMKHVNTRKIHIVFIIEIIS